MNVPENKTRLISWPTSGPEISCLEISFKVLKIKIWLIFTFFVKSMTKQVKQNCPPLYRKKNERSESHGPKQNKSIR